ncbi:MAG: T9SS type A sorting domain-containing protein [Saprospiraceae bacterium]|nr:T9SS type A sorting domain-containing protein [Saprospiraceae bacterium]MDZ4706495.1 T9SS type A sorting domain-containing protein [Saprospiraceae bacterium]
MRKVLLLVVGLLPVFAWGQAQRTVLIEHFTNASCGPCAAQNPDFHALLSDNTTNVVAIKYQAPFPGYDPMNEANPTQVDTRSTYYNLSGVPTAWIDGVLPGDIYGGGIGDWDVAGGGYEGGPYGYNQAVLAYAAGLSTPITIDLTHSLNATLDEITITAVVTNLDTVAFTVAAGRFHVVLVEKEVKYFEAPGSNGETIFHNVMRRMYPGDTGSALNTIAAGESVTFTFTEPLPTYIADKREIGVIAFYQDNATQSVYQAAYSQPQPIANALDASFGGNLTVDPVGLCGATIVPVASITNNGEAEITSLEIGLAVNGTPVAIESWTGTLAAGASETITFDEFALSGTSSVTFVILNVNGEETDLNQLNNVSPSENYSAISDEVYGTDLNEDNEDYDGTYPTIAVIEEPIPDGEFGSGTFQSLRRNQLTGSAGDPVGGYGLSERSLFVNFYQWNPAGAVNDFGTMTYPKLDFSNTTNGYLKFDRSHARYQGSSDRLQILASPDCGATWTIVYNKAAAALATRPDQDAFFLPPTNGWVTDSVSLSAFDGTPELNIQFKALSNWGNNLYIDNINVSGLIVGTQDLEDLLAGKVAVFPNPASTVVNIEFELVAATAVTIEILNVNGQLVETLDQNRDYTAGQYIRTWNPENAGVYMARIRTALGESTQRIVVGR